MKIIKKLISSDSSVKYLFELTDGESIEAVYIPQPDGVNLCISCQVGCVNKCKHCATSRIEYVRDLASEEIIEQTTAMLEDRRFARGKVKILFMGMGEPLFNYGNVLAAINMFKAQPWLHSVHDITVSTSGIVPNINKLAKEITRPRLAITIGATSDDKRSWLLVPVGKLYDLSITLAACRQYTETTKESVIFQYPLIKNFNDSSDEAKALSNLITDIPCEVHVIPFNEFEGSVLRRPTDDELSHFCQTLASYDLKVTQKPSFGVDIDAGCGQLKAMG
jgi:23S rRNA (adenine2503-C2)-methyltransferase